VAASKRKLIGGAEDAESKARKLGPAAAAGSELQPMRRSSRVKQAKNTSKRFTVSSSNTLHELKMKVDRRLHSFLTAV